MELTFETVRSMKHPAESLIKQVPDETETVANMVDT